jgi:hypothetical protein
MSSPVFLVVFGCTVHHGFGGLDVCVVPLGKPKISIVNNDTYIERDYGMNRTNEQKT